MHGVLPSSSDDEDGTIKDACYCDFGDLKETVKFLDLGHPVLDIRRPQLDETEKTKSLTEVLEPILENAHESSSSDSEIILETNLEVKELMVHQIN